MKKNNNDNRPTNINKNKINNNINKSTQHIEIKQFQEFQTK